MNNISIIKNMLFLYYTKLLSENTMYTYEVPTKSNKVQHINNE